ADGDRHLAAIDDGRHDEAAQSRLVGNIDGHAQRASDRREAGILVVVACGSNDQGAPADLIDAGTGGNKRDTAGALKLGKLGPELGGGNIDDLGALQEKPRLDGATLAAARYQRRLPLDADEDGKGPHLFLSPNCKALNRRVG